MKTLYRLQAVKTVKKPRIRKVYTSFVTQKVELSPSELICLVSEAEGMWFVSRKYHKSNNQVIPEIITSYLASANLEVTPV